MSLMKTENKTGSTGSYIFNRLNSDSNFSFFFKLNHTPDFRAHNSSIDLMGKKKLIRKEIRTRSLYEYAFFS